MSPISQKVILVAAIIIALFALVFFIWRPIAPDLERIENYNPAPAAPAPSGG